MSSIAAGANSERTNRWLLIGAAVLAVLTGVLLFLALANFSGGDSEKSATQAVGDSKVLVAKQTIQPNTKITAAMFETATVASASLVDGAVTDQAQVLDKVARTIVLKGEQLTTNRIGTVEGKAEPGFRDTIPSGRRAVAVKVTEQSSVAGLLVPGDRVDVIATFTEKRQDQNETTRVETVLQNIEVLAFAQKSLEALPSLNAQGTPIATDSSEGSLGERPTDLAPNRSAGTATLSLSPEEVQTIVAAEAKGELTLALRAPADAAVPPIAPTRLDDNGFVIPRP